MSTPLEIKIALHYWTTPAPYSADDPAHANSPAVQDACERMVEAGLLQPHNQQSEAKYSSTDAMCVFVDALCSVHWPIQEWVIPK